MTSVSSPAVRSRAVTKRSRRWWFVLGLLAILTGGLRPAMAASVVRGPYLQTGTSSSVVVRWRTDEPTKSQVNYGLQPDDLASKVKASVNTTEHELTVDGLLPATRYYYSVGTFQDVLAGGDAEHFFETAPLAGTAQPMRVWVLGDSGSADTNVMAVRDAYLGFGAGQHTDLWLMLGDNAYPDGTDLQYQAALFDIFPQTLRQSVLWPTIGNHDVRRVDPAAADYFDLFTLPTAGEAGGMPSGTESYYAFDHANVHFVVLDSQSSDRAVGGPMLTWLAADLAATDQDWIVALWHHPPYSKGSHDSDDTIVDPELTAMRVATVPLLESHGVDLVLCGHSHSYERSFLLDGHHGFSDTFGPQHVIDGGDGDPSGDGAYTKPAYPGVPNQGTVYTVAGSSGRTTGGALDHPAMFLSLNTLGSVVLDIDGNTLDARFLDDTGVVQDHFGIVKDPALVHDFMAGPTVGIAPLTVDFDDLSLSQPTAWAWDFDDDGVVDSTEQHPSFTYPLPGSYSVRLTVESAIGSAEVLKQDYIQVELGQPIANFDAVPRTGTVPLSVSFVDLSQQLPDQWRWDFDHDDDVDSTLQHPTHIYTATGLYSVQLTVSNAVGADSLVRVAFIEVLPDVPEAVTGLQFEPGGGVAIWDTLPSACAYDLAVGDLVTLRATSGDHTAAALGCVGEDVPSTQTTVPDDPGVGQSYFYLVRGVNCELRAETYDTAGIGQVASRDAAVQAAATTCSYHPGRTQESATGDGTDGTLEQRGNDERSR